MLKQTQYKIFTVHPNFTQIGVSISHSEFILQIQWDLSTLRETEGEMSERASSGVLHPLSSRHEDSHSISQKQLLIILTGIFMKS